MSDEVCYEKGAQGYRVYLSRGDQVQRNSWGYCVTARTPQNGKRWQCSAYLDRKQRGIGHSRDEAVQNARQKAFQA